MADSPSQSTVSTSQQQTTTGALPMQVPQQFQPPMPHPPQSSQKGNGFAVAALVLGIVALVFCWIPFLNVLSIILGLIGLGLGVPGLIGSLRGRRSGKGMAITGLVLSVVAMIAAVAISAAATVAVDEALSGTDVSTSSADDSSSGASDNAAGDDPSTTDGVYAFGELVTFEDGSTLTVEAPVEFRPKKFAFGGEAFSDHVKFQATFTNNTDKVFDPGLTTGNVTSAGVEGESVYQEGLDAPENPVLPGKSITWWMGYGVQDPADTQLTVRLGFLDYDDVIFTP
jgi:hypothetical protein